jgi:transcriptional regulator with GAF, ATPase, and Fis domain
MSQPSLPSAQGSSPSADLHAALSEVARAIADSLEVREIWDRVFHACRTIVPVDAMGIVCLEPEGKVRAVAVAGPPEVLKLEGVVFPRAAMSPRFWPDEERFVVLANDVERDLDMSYAMDRRTIEFGFHSVIRVSLSYSGKRLGSVLLSARERGRFTMLHAQQLAVVAELITVALAHEQRALALAEEIRRTAEAHARAALLEERVQTLAKELEHLSPHRALGSSRKWRDVLGYATKVAPTDTTVLLSGESGTGKEVVARFIHNASPRKSGPFVALNCAALPEQLLESELFGHEKGAFTGALSARAGKVEQAAKGVLFLDEVGEMSPGVQAKFLRVLQEREFQRVGGSRTMTADVRVLAATNRDLKASIARGTFREDLYYRLAVFDIALPPLRERREDIGLLTDAFLDMISRSVGRPAAGVTDEARRKLDGYAWPGNVRELRNVVERAVILCEGGLIDSGHLPLTVVGTDGNGNRAAPAARAAEASPALTTLDAAERDMIVQALAKSGNNKSKAARLLGLTRAQMRSRLEKHGIVAEG